MDRMQHSRRDGSGDRGVSPVIGVILMVAIVVVLAAVVATFALGFGDDTQANPPSFGGTVRYNQSTDGIGQSITIDRKAGDDIPVSKLSVDVIGAEVVDSGGTRIAVEYTGNALSSIGSDLDAGDSITIDRGDFSKSGGSIGANEHLDLSHATVQFVWTDGPDTSAIVFQWKGKNHS